MYLSRRLKLFITLLFSIFRNYLPYVFDLTNIVMYADDSTMFSAAHTLTELQEHLSDELLTITKWVRINKLILNWEKTKYIVFSNKNSMTKAAHLNLFITGVPVEQVTHVKLLGVMLDNTLSWSKHIDNIVSTMGKGMVVACIDRSIHAYKYIHSPPEHSGNFYDWAYIGYIFLIMLCYNTIWIIIPIS